jgi:flagellar M-ring protein FliF
MERGRAGNSVTKLLANLSGWQRAAVVGAVVLAGTGIYTLVRWQREADFRPLFTGLAAEDAAAIVQKLKETGVEYRLPEEGGSVLVRSARLPEVRLALAAAGLPKSGRIGFELFDKTNLGATEFSERVNYRRALEGELERSVMSLAEVSQARVHVTFPKESVFLESQQPAKASVLVRIRPEARLAPQNVVAIAHLVASAVEGLAPDAVSVLDMNGNLLGRPRAPGGLDGPEPSEAGLDYRRRIEADLVAKINATLEPLLGANRFRAAASVECDFSGGELSEEIYDPARSVMLSSQRTEDSSGVNGAGGVPGTASALPRPAPRPAASSGQVSRTTENITYQSSRTVKKTRLPAGAIRKMSLAVLVDQDVTWQAEGGQQRRVLVPPAPEKLKAIRDLVAGVTGFTAERGDQIAIETLPFETTLLTEPPEAPGPAPARPIPPKPLGISLDRRTLLVGGGAAAVLLLIVTALAMRLRRGRKRVSAEVAVPPALPPGEAPGSADGAAPAGEGMQSTLAERDGMQKQLESQALNALKLAPVVSKASEVLAKHLREKIKEDSETPSQILRTWIAEEDA